MPPIFPDNASGRWELANWLTDTSHPLTARVIVNRVWGWHFGRGLVSSTENFGVQRERPTHPELIGLASEAILLLVAGRLRSLHRLILLSSTYRMSSAHQDVAEYITVSILRIDFYGSFPIRRLDAEQSRDVVLATCGRLDLRLNGKTVHSEIGNSYLITHRSIIRNTIVLTRDLSPNHSKQFIHLAGAVRLSRPHHANWKSKSNDGSASIVAFNEQSVVLESLTCSLIESYLSIAIIRFA